MASRISVYSLVSKKMNGAQKTLLGGLVLIFESLGRKLVGVISTLILARVLVPEDFGLVAICTLTMGFIQIFVQVGTEEYLLSAKELDNDTINTSWTINFILKTAVVIILILSSGLIADYFEDARVTTVLIAYALSLFVCCFYNPGLILFRREHKYVPIAKLTIASKIIAVTTAVSIALIYESYWALVIGQITNDIMRTIGGYLLHSYRPKFCLKNAKQQWQFSGWLIPQSILGYGRTQLDTFLVSSTFGANVLGSYHVMKYLAFIPCSEILLPATQPLLVELSKLKDNKNEFTLQYNVTALVTFSMAFFISCFMFIEQHLVVSILLGANWIQYAQLIGYFALLIPAYAMFHHARRAQLVFAQTRSIFIYEIFSFGIMYSILLFVGLADLNKFTYLRVLLENFFSLILLFYVTYKFISPSNTIKLVLLSVPILLASITAMTVSKLISFAIPILLLVFVKGAAYLASFVLIILLCYALLFNRFKEWQYIYGLTSKAAKKLTKSYAK